jgi:hypothetical protein
VSGWLQADRQPAGHRRRQWQDLVEGRANDVQEHEQVWDQRQAKFLAKLAQAWSAAPPPPARWGSPSPQLPTRARPIPRRPGQQAAGRAAAPGPSRSRPARRCPL